MKPARSLTTVVFDVGMVLLDWNPRYLYRHIFADATEMEWFLANVCTTEWNHAQDGGRPWPDAEAEAISRYPAYADQVRAFRARWQEMVPGAVAGSVAILEALAKAGVPLYAITNFAGDTFAESCARFPFFAHFRGILVSGRIGALKPDSAIYQRLATDYDVELTRCLFIDDVPANVTAARAIGMTAVQFTTPEQLAEDLREQGFAV